MACKRIVIGRPSCYIGSKLEKHADIARSNIERANLNDRVEVRTGLALDSLQQIENEKYGTI